MKRDFNNPAYVGYVCAVIAGQTYEDYDGKNNPFKSVGFKVLEFFNNDGAQGYLLSHRNILVLSFRGTEPDQFNDLAADLNALPDEAEAGGHVHDGFQNEVLDIYPSVHKSVTEYFANNKVSKFFITGHSLGAAMATIAASKLQDEVKIDCLYTYGSPRAGNKTFVENCLFEHYRYVNNNDIVTRVPPALLFYKHHGELMYFNTNGKLVKYNKWQEILDRLRGVVSAWAKFKPFDGLMDHSMSNYIINCKRACEEQKEG